MANNSSLIIQHSLSNYESTTNDIIFDLPFNKSDVDLVDVNNLDASAISNSSVTLTKTFPIIPNSVLFWYLVCVHGLGVILNTLVIFDLFRRKRPNGFFMLIFQMAASDIMLLTIVAVPELWSHNTGSWIFGSEMCAVYLGFEVFSGTSNVYFLIAICFHTITMANLLLENRYKQGKDSEEELLDEMTTEIKSSRHSLVSRNNDSLPMNKGTDVVENRNKTTKIPVIVPVALVWILAASLSVPEFVLSTTIVTRSGPNICTFVDGQKFNNVRILLSVFQLLLPAILVLIFVVTMMYYIHKYKLALTKDTTEMLKLSICLQILFVLLNTPRSILSSLHVFSFSDESLDKISDGEVLDIFKAPPLNNSIVQEAVLLVVSFLYFSASIFRPMVYGCFVISKKTDIMSKVRGYSDEISEENSL